MGVRIKTIKITALKRAAAQTGPSNTVNGSAVDLQTFAEDSEQYQAVLDVSATAGTTPSLAVKVQESDSTTSTTFTDITGAAFTTVTTSTGNASPESIYFVTNKRYIRLVSVTDTNTTSATFGAYLVAGQRVV